MARRLGAGTFNIHKSCYDKFNESKRKRANSAKKRKSTEDEAAGVVTRGQCPTTISFGDELCMHCGSPAFVDPKHKENNVPLHAAARKKIKRGYVDEFTDNLRKMATKLGDTNILTQLCSDARCSELYYHNVCHSGFKHRYEEAVQNTSEDTANSADQWFLDEFVALSAVKDYADCSNADSFPLIDLEKIYIQKLAELGHETQSHTTRFASKLNASDIGLSVIQAEKCSRYVAAKKESLEKIIPDSDWINLIRKVVNPIRQEVIAAHRMEKPHMSDLQSWKISYQ